MPTIDELVSQSLEAQKDAYVAQAQAQINTAQAQAQSTLDSEQKQIQSATDNLQLADTTLANKVAGFSIGIIPKAYQGTSAEVTIRDSSSSVYSLGVDTSLNPKPSNMTPLIAIGAALGIYFYFIKGR